MNEKPKFAQSPTLYTRCEPHDCPVVRARVELERYWKRVLKPSPERGRMLESESPQRAVWCSHQVKCAVQPRPETPPDFDRCHFR